MIGTVLGKDTQVGGQRQYGNTYNVGDIEGSTGVVIGEKNQVAVTQGVSAEEIAKAFSILLQAVQSKPDGPEKTMAQTAVKGLEEEAGKGEQADESRVEKWFSFLAQMAPDVRDVAIDTFTNPIKGISTVFKKIAERAKAEKGTDG